MKLEETRITMDVKVIQVMTCTDEEKFIGKIGKVINIFSDFPYPIEVDFGYKTGLFEPEELEEV